MLRVPLQVLQRSFAAVLQPMAALLSHVGFQRQAAAWLALALRLQPCTTAAPYPRMPGSDMASGPGQKLANPLTRALLMAAGAAAMVVTVVALRALMARQRASMPYTAGVQVQVASAAFAEQHAAATITEEEARTTIYAWIAAKQRAFGPQHDAEALQVVLAGPMLQEWQQKAAETSEQDWYWHYQPSDILVRATEAAMHTKIASDQVYLTRSMWCCTWLLPASCTGPHLKGALLQC